MGCPIAGTYLLCLTTQVSESIVYDSKRAMLQLLSDRARADKNEAKQIKLRAFLALEIMATRGVASLSPLDAGTITRLRWDRSAKGIAKLLREVRIEKGEGLAANAEFALLGGSRDAEQLATERRKKYVAIIETLEATAMLVRRSLRFTTVWMSLGIVGNRLWESTKLLGVDAKIGIAEELLELTEDADRRAWEPRIQSLR